MHLGEVRFFLRGDQESAMPACIAWKDFYSVGDRSLDAEHKQIIGVINDLYDAMHQGRDHTLVKPLLDRLVQYTAVHFRHEEQVMRQCEYPELPQHRAHHDRLRRNTAGLRDNVDLVTGRDMLRFLKDWWLGHIQGEDKKYAPYVAGGHLQSVQAQS
jgi:hemerythrin-like metal-binding protein